MPSSHVVYTPQSRENFGATKLDILSDRYGKAPHFRAFKGFFAATL
jgi:hypothetical protein